MDNVEFNRAYQWPAPPFSPNTCACPCCTPCTSSTSQAGIKGLRKWGARASWRYTCSSTTLNSQRSHPPAAQSTRAPGGTVTTGTKQRRAPQDQGYGRKRFRVVKWGSEAASSRWRPGRGRRSQPAAGPLQITGNGLSAVGFLAGKIWLACGQCGRADLRGADAVSPGAAGWNAVLDGTQRTMFYCALFLCTILTVVRRLRAATTEHMFPYTTHDTTQHSWVLRDVTCLCLASADALSRDPMPR